MGKNNKLKRAWVEINLQNLEHNINQIKSVIPKETKIMPVIKANAYGHGMIEIAKKLNEIGIQDFAVATLAEGIKLRTAGIKGNILILGFTDFEEIKYILENDLIQTIVDYDYAKKINEMELPNKLKVHIKINTGMNRIGENYKNVGNIVKIYQMKNLDILGTFSHLSCSDSMDSNDIKFTQNQIDNFFKCVNNIKQLGFNPGKVHIQASYGILNYPELHCDYVRPGIIMYGVNSEFEQNTKIRLDLKPVLSLKARVTSVKQINKDDSVSYGRSFIAKDALKLATISIGYADGYPRSLSNKGAKVKINGQFAEIVGRICMDQLIVDVTGIKDVKQGDVALLIGEEKEISAEKVSFEAGTITNELLCRLGDRLEYSYKIDD